MTLPEEVEFTNVRVGSSIAGVNGDTMKTRKFGPVIITGDVPTVMQLKKPKPFIDDQIKKWGNDDEVLAQTAIRTSKWYDGIGFRLASLGI